MYFDLLLLFLICLFAVFGYIHGFIRQILSLLSLLCIIFFAQPLALWLKESSGWSWFEQAPQLVLFGISSFAIILFFTMVSGIIYLIRKGAGLAPVDRWIGGGLGALKGFIVALLMALGVQLLPEHTQTKFSELYADTTDSVFTKMSKPMLEWRSLSAFKTIREIKEQLKAPKKDFMNKSDPWAQGQDWQGRDLFDDD